MLGRRLGLRAFRGPVRCMSTTLEALRARGFVADVTHPEDSAAVLAGPTRVYAGYDPTADGLHVGSLVTLMCLAHMQRRGHTPVVLLGGATGLIGDPSGRDTERSLLDEQTARHNVARVSADALTVLQRAGDPAGPAPIVVNNADWYTGMGALAFLRDVGRHFRVPAMLRRESVQRRMESHEGISFTEFSYQLLQAHDFYHLNRAHGVTLQIGGTDQWGNIMGGIDYAKRRGVQQRVAGLTVPLIQTKDGQKLGKSAGNAVWLAESKTSHFDLYQYFVKTPTDDVVRSWMLLMTLLSEEEITAALAVGDGHAQRVLARSVVELVRGPEAAASAEAASAALYYARGDLGEPNVAISRSFVGRNVLDVALHAGLTQSKSEARRLIQQGGLYVNDVRVDDVEFAVAPDTAGCITMRAGKKKKLLIRFDN